MKVVYIGAVKDGTGYAHFANDMILGLDAAGVDVASRHVKLSTQIVNPPNRIEELEKKNINGVTHVIQHILPCYFSYYSGFKNIGLFHMETDYFAPSAWQFYCNLMDELWVSCPENKDAAIKSGVIKPIKVVPKPCDDTKYDRYKYSKLLNNIGSRYSFYHIGDYSTRKNSLNLIKCYLETFTKYDNVVLVLKTYVEGCNPNESMNLIKEDIQKLKHSMRKYMVDIYPPIIIVTDYLSNDQILQLHAQCDCFVSLECGAAWNVPAFDAAAMGKWCILNGWGGQTQFIEQGRHGFLLPYKMESVYGMTRCPYPMLYTANEKWAIPDYNEFKDLLRKVYISRPSIDDSNRQKLFDKYNYKTSGNVLRELLN
jgi:glycosyltransferase involved in cell wall biosynthesis